MAVFLKVKVYTHDVTYIGEGVSDGKPHTEGTGDAGSIEPSLPAFGHNLMLQPLASQILPHKLDQVGEVTASLFHFGVERFCHFTADLDTETLLTPLQMIDLLKVDELISDDVAVLIRDLAHVLLPSPLNSQARSRPDLPSSVPAEHRLAPWLVG